MTLGLLHGSQPDALVLCHDPSRETIEGYPHIKLPSLKIAIDRYIEAGQLTNPQVRCVGVAINSSSLDQAGWEQYRSVLEAKLGLPVCDPMRGGVDSIARKLI